MVNPTKSWTCGDYLIHEFESLVSTNSFAFNLALQNQLTNHEIILAKQQSCGKGRMNRVWQSPIGNLYFSLLLKNPILSKLKPNQISQISFLAIGALGLAIEESIKSKSKFVENVNNYTKNQQKSGLEAVLVQFKWPNDLLINQKKVAGALIESNFKQQNCDFVVVGIGVNNEVSPKIPEAYNSQQNSPIYPITSLCEVGLNIENKNLLELFLKKFQPLFTQWLDFGFNFAKNLWLSHAFGLNKKIRLKTGDENEKSVIEGIFVGIDEEGNLQLKNGDEIKKFSFGEIMKTEFC